MGLCGLFIMDDGLCVAYVLAREAYFKELEQSYGHEYVQTLASITPLWTLPIMFVLTIVGGLLGAWLGKKMFSKHFKRRAYVSKISSLFKDDRTRLAQLDPRTKILLTITVSTILISSGSSQSILRIMITLCSLSLLLSIYKYLAF